MTKLFLKTVKAKPFTNDDGEEMAYYWYKGTDQHDGVTRQYGCKSGELQLNAIGEYDVEKTERVDGKFGYKILIEN